MKPFCVCTWEVILSWMSALLATLPGVVHIHRLYCCRKQPDLCFTLAIGDGGLESPVPCTAGSAQGKADVSFYCSNSVGFNPNAMWI